MAAYGVRAPLKRPAGEANRRALWNRYRRAAAKRGHEWALDYERFVALVSADCDYCGASPAQVSRAKPTFNGAFVYSGIDRQNNALGYVDGNVVSCCGTCNFAKRGLGVAEFLAHVRRICAHQEEKARAAVG